MPKISAYKHNGTIIPVDKAKIGTAYQCPWTGRIVATKRSYVKHLKDLRKDRIHKAIKERKFNLLGENFRNQSNFNKIIDWIHLHPEWFLENSMRNDDCRSERYNKKLFDKFSIEMINLNLRWSSHVSNSHSCPLNGVTNWCNSYDDRPTGYPGWQGRIKFKTTCEIPGFMSALFKNTGINLGSGGGGGQYYTYDVSIFVDDWPKLRKATHLSLLKNNTYSENFVYTNEKYKNVEKL